MFVLSHSLPNGGLDSHWYFRLTMYLDMREGGNNYIVFAQCEVHWTGHLKP
jgi:hypothetical protein